MIKKQKVSGWGCGMNATLKHIERIRKIVNKAVSLDWLERDPFQAFQGKQQKTYRTFLTEDELTCNEYVCGFILLDYGN